MKITYPLRETTALGRRRRRVVHVIRKTLPKVFTCPNCGMVAVRLQPKESTTVISCGSCGISQEISNRGKEPIDIYNEFIDRFNSGQTGEPNTGQRGIEAQGFSD